MLTTSPRFCHVIFNWPLLQNPLKLLIHEHYQFFYSSKSIEIIVVGFNTLMSYCPTKLTLLTPPLLLSFINNMHMIFIKPMIVFAMFIYASLMNLFWLKKYCNCFLNMVYWISHCFSWILHLFYPLSMFNLCTLIIKSTSIWFPFCVAFVMVLCVA